MWLRTARLLPLVDRGAGLLQEIAPATVREADPAAARKLGRSLEKAAQTGRALQQLDDAAGAIGGEDGQGYGARERSGMQQLMRKGEQ